jgi:hypothetical protein
MLDIWTRAETQAEGAWKEHIAAWKKWHGLNLREAPGFAALMAFVEARNAIMHGLGQLTKRQMRRDGGREVISKLSSVGIPVIARRLSIDDPVVDNCADTVRSYIHWLDLKVQTSGLDRVV